MSSTYITLTYWDLGLASVFLILNALLSIWLKLDLTRQITISAARMIVQLLLVGLVLKAVFAIASPWLTLLLALIMACLA